MWGSLSGVSKFVMYGSREVQVSARRHFRTRRASSACGRTFSTCGDVSPHAEVPFRRAETYYLRIRRYLFGVRRASSACGGTFSACGDILSPHTEVPFRRAESQFRMRRYLLGVRRACNSSLNHHSLVVS